MSRESYDNDKLILRVALYWAGGGKHSSGVNVLVLLYVVEVDQYFLGGGSFCCPLLVA